jgi:cyanate permease
MKRILDGPVRVTGIVITAAWIGFSFMRYESVVLNHHGNAWLRALVFLALPVGLPLFAMLWMDEGRARERAGR